MAVNLETIQSVIDAFRQGEILVVTDDDDRENEGDLIVAASLCTPEKMAFIVRHTSGIVCAPLTVEEARRLRLDPMVAANDAPLGTAFTITVDVRHGLTTGISAEERTNTVRALANGNMGAGDFVRPGHVFPLIARPGGVLMRSGHTEAAVDLCKLAGLPAVGTICELVNDDGTVMRGPQIVEFAKTHGLKSLTVADLIAYRQARERLIERVGELSVTTPIGLAQGIAYRSPFDTVEQLALVFGSIGDGKDVPVRLHRQDLLNDTFGDQRMLKAVYERFQKEGRGVLVYLRESVAGVPAGSLAGSAETEDHASASTRQREWREIGLGAQILRDLDISSIRLISGSSKQRRFVGLEGFGITISGTDVL